MNQLKRYNKGGIGRWYWDYRDRQVLKFLRPGPTLDVGCGDGITTRKIPGAIGIDTGYKKSGGVGNRWYGSAYKIPANKNQFNNILLLEVIEHLESPLDALYEIYRVLKPGGRLIMLFPNDRTFKLAWFLTGMWGEIGRDRGHLREWWPEMAEEELKFCGFKILAQKSIPFRVWPLSLHHIIVAEKP